MFLSPDMELLDYQNTAELVLSTLCDLLQPHILYVSSQPRTKPISVVERLPHTSLGSLRISVFNSEW